MKSVLAIVLLLILYSCNTSTDKNTDDLLDKLKAEIAKKKLYDGEKELRIKKLKDSLNTVSKTNYKAQYNICSKLYDEYKVYQFDSAYVYNQKMLGLSRLAYNLQTEYESKIKQAAILLYSGMFKETFDCLNHINSRSLDDSTRLAYYELMKRAYNDLGKYNNDKTYSGFDVQQAKKYDDSAAVLRKPNNYFEKQLALSEIAGQKIPAQYYIDLMDRQHLSKHGRAMVATRLGYAYKGRDRIFFLVMGAINDIRSSTKETQAIFSLGKELYSQGDLKNAYIFIQQAMTDAQFYGARIRKVEISALLPVVAAKTIIRTKNEEQRFITYLTWIVALTIIIALVLFIVFIQLRRLKVKDAIILENNKQLKKINESLFEQSQIKEEYIGYFFNSISSYIAKLEKVKRTVEHKMKLKRYDEILAVASQINIKTERENLFNTFDHIFLKLFPNFIEAFNSLLKPEDQLWPKENEVLNAHLRIFALMRLGINDNETVAGILEYTVNTVYTYKNRIKLKALVHGDEFDAKIMAIKFVDIT